MTQYITELKRISCIVKNSTVGLITSQPTFTAKTVKLDLFEKFDRRSTALTSQLFDIELFCALVGIASPSKMVKLAKSKLEKEAHTLWWQINKHGVDYSLGHLDWWQF